MRTKTIALLALLAVVPDAIANPPIPLPRPAAPSGPTLGPFTLPLNAPEDIVLSGAIEDDAPSQFLRVLRARPGARRLILNSEGGKVDPALILAKEVFSRQLATFVPSNAACYSACSFIFFGGKPHSVATGGSLGVHQIYGAQDPSTVQITFSDVFDTLRVFDVPDRVISQMLRTPPEAMHVFSPTELDELGLSTPQSQNAAPNPASQAPQDSEADIGATDPSAIEGNQSLLLEASGDPAKGALPFSGALQWSTVRDASGAIALTARAELPARGLSVEIEIHENSDASVTASHIVEVRFETGSAFDGGAVAGLPGVLVKDEELIQGTPLVGASMRTTANRFRFFLSRDDVALNMNLLAKKRWIDLALVYSTGRRAIVTLERNDAAMLLTSEALASWSAVGNQTEMGYDQTVLPMTKSAADRGVGRSERLVSVEESFKDTVVRNGFDAQTYEMATAALRHILTPERIPAGAQVLILMGPARNEARLIPHRLSVYIPDASGALRHAATVALTDRGNYALGNEPSDRVTDRSQLPDSTASTEGDSTSWLKVDRPR